MELQAGKSFFKYGSHWLADTVTIDENERFTWLVVKARWAGYGPMPLWANEQHTFLMFRRRKETNEYV